METRECRHEAGGGGGRTTKNERAPSPNLIQAGGWEPQVPSKWGLGRTADRKTFSEDGSEQQMLPRYPPAYEAKYYLAPSLAQDRRFSPQRS